MEELYSNAVDCQNLACMLYQSLGKKFDLYGSWSNPLASGKYYTNGKKNPVSFYYKCLDDYSFNVLCADENLTKEMIVEELSKKDSIFVTNVDVIDDIFKRLGYEKDKHESLL